MRIEIDFSAADDPDAHKWLDRILHKIDDGWHVWDTTSQPDPNAIEAATWIGDRGDQGDWVRGMLVASIQRDAWASAHPGRRVRVTACPEDTDELTPEDAARLAEEPLVILVENRFSDGAFVKRVVTELDKSLHKIWGRPGEPIRVDSLGGTGQMSKEVERRTQGRPYRPRMIVIIDGDRRGPCDTESDTVQALRSTCEKRNVSCWVLAKRESENYLPRILLGRKPDAGADHDQLLEAWDRLDDDQKNFFDMKKGLPKAPSAIEQALFDGLSPTCRKTLSRGFGPNVYKCWCIWGEQIKAELTDRGQGDLERGIKLIREAI